MTDAPMTVGELDAWWRTIETAYNLDPSSSLDENPFVARTRLALEERERLLLDVASITDALGHVNALTEDDILHNQEHVLECLREFGDAICAITGKEGKETPHD